MPYRLWHSSCMNLKITSLNSNDGLPVEQVHKIDIDFMGKLWLATSSGLACYNGADVKVFDSRTGLNCVGLRTVSILFNDEVWVGTDQGIEVLNLNGQKKNFDFDFEWKYGIAECITVINNVTYIGTSDGLLQLSRNADAFTLTHHFNLGFVRSLVQISENNLLAVTANEGLVKLSGNQWNIFNKEIPQGNAVICVEKTLDNYILLGTVSGLYVLNKEGAIVHRPLSNYEIKVTNIAISGSDWWLGFGNELVLLNLNSEGIIQKESIFLESTINDILIDDYGNVWCATNNSGLKKITCLRSVIEYVDYGKSGSTYSIKALNNPNSFMVTGDGLASIISHKPFEKATDCQPVFNKSTIVWDSCMDPNDSNKFWYATQDGLYVATSGQEPVKFSDETKLINAPNRVLQVIDKTIWLGTISGLFCINHNSVQEILNDEGERFGYVYTLAISNANELWIGTLGQGLWLKTIAGIVHFVNDTIFPVSNIYSIAINESNEVAVLQEESLILIEEDRKTKRIIQEFPMMGWAVCWITDDAVAVGSNNGVILVNLRINAITSRINLHLNKSDWQFTCSRSLILIDRRYLFCAINGGLYVVDLDGIKEYECLPEIYIDEISWLNTEPEKLGDTYVIPTGKWSVNIAAFTPWYVAETQIQYRYKLVGFDENWSGLSHLNGTKYNSLPPGEYKLQVQTYTPLTGFSEIKPLINFEVITPWWSNVMSPIVNSGSSFYNKFFKSRIRNKRLIEKNVDLQSEIENRKILQLNLTKNQKQLEDVLHNYQRTEEELQISNTNLRQLSSRLQKLIEDEKKAIAREVHDVLGQQLTSLKWDTSWLNKKLKDKEPEYSEKAGEMIKTIDDTITTVRKISTELRPSVLDDFGLEAAIEWHAKAFEKLTDINCQLEFESLSEGYTEDVKTAVFRIFQESLTNIIRHAQASKVIVKLLEENKNLLVLEIIDNGLGISDERKNNTKSLGLLGMNERVRILGGTFLIRKLPIQGTAVKITLPIKNENINS